MPTGTYRVENKRPVPKDEMREWFEELDQNGDGYLSAKELRSLVSKLLDFEDLAEGEMDEVVEEMMRVADINDDGSINFEEFFKFMTG